MPGDRTPRESFKEFTLLSPVPIPILPCSRPRLASNFLEILPIHRRKKSHFAWGSLKWPWEVTGTHVPAHISSSWLKALHWLLACHRIKSKLLAVAPACLVISSPTTLPVTQAGPHTPALSPLKFTKQASTSGPLHLLLLLPGTLLRAHLQDLLPHLLQGSAHTSPPQSDLPRPPPVQQDTSLLCPPLP